MSRNSTTQHTTQSTQSTTQSGTHTRKEKLQVAEVMTHDPVTVSPHASLNDAAHLLWTHEVSCLPVVGDDRRVLGILTDRDIAMCAYTQGRPLADLSVRLAMQAEVICAHASDELGAITDLMEQNRVRRMPVIDNTGGLIGIVSRGDIRSGFSAREHPSSSAGSLPSTMAGAYVESSPRVRH